MKKNYKKIIKINNKRLGRLKTLYYFCTINNQRKTKKVKKGQ